MIAALPMYDRDETFAANDRLWAHAAAQLRARGIPAPAALSRGANMWDYWRAPDLLLSQTCGLPYRSALHDRVALIGSPVNRIDCAGGHYYSVIVTAAGNPRRDWAGAHAAINGPDSQSGWGALWEWLDGTPLGRITVSGAHRASAELVASGAVDLAAIDAATWTQIQRWDPSAAGLEVIGRSNPTPALPFITAPGQDTAAVYDALEAAIAALPEADRDALCLDGITRVPHADYIARPLPPAPAETLLQSA